MKINPQTDALIVIDIQNDFCPGGALAVARGDEIIPRVLEIAPLFDTIILSQDWHPAHHASFASTQNAAPFSNMELPYGSQTLWPDHCIQGSTGAAFHEGIKNLVEKSSAIIRKGMNPNIDSYSAFFENDKVTPTGLSGMLLEKGIKRVFFVGLAYDFCVGYSALDASKAGFQSVVLKDATASIAMPLEKGTTEDLMTEKFSKKGILKIVTTDLIPSRSLKY